MEECPRYIVDLVPEAGTFATMHVRSKEWPRQSRTAVGSAASYGVSIVSSKLFPSILT
jgi:hypothetical protein